MKEDVSHCNDGTTVIKYSWDDEPGYLEACAAARLLLVRGIQGLPAQEWVKRRKGQKTFGPWGIRVSDRKHDGRKRGPTETLVFVASAKRSPAAIAMQVIAELQEVRKREGYAHAGTLMYICQTRGRQHKYNEECQCVAKRQP